MRKIQVFEIIKSFGFIITCSSFIRAFLVIDDSRGLFFRLPENQLIINVFIGFMLVMLFDALQRWGSFPKLKKPIYAPSVKRREKIVSWLKYVVQMIILVFNLFEITVSILALPLVIIFGDIYQGCVVSKGVVVCSAMLFCFRMLYIIGTLFPLRKKESQDAS